MYFSPVLLHIFRLLWTIKQFFRLLRVAALTAKGHRRCNVTFNPQPCHRPHCKCFARLMVSLKFTSRGCIQATSFPGYSSETRSNRNCQNSSAYLAETSALCQCRVEPATFGMNSTLVCLRPRQPHVGHDVAVSGFP